MRRRRPIVVLDYKPSWEEDFKTLRNKLWEKVKGIAVSIEHVGSTSVPGLAAKPVIDLDIVIKERSHFSPVRDALEELGYEHRGDLGIADREAFSLPEEPIVHNLYVCVEGSLALKNHLVIRDHLRAYAADRSRYSELKKALAKAYPDDITSYVDGKTDLILEILGKYELDQSELDQVEKVNRK